MPLPTGSPRTLPSPPSCPSVPALCPSAAVTLPAAARRVLTSLARTSPSRGSLDSGSLPQSTKVTATTTVTSLTMTSNTPPLLASSVVARRRGSLHRRLTDVLASFHFLVLS
jgi:hypothetical protein